MQKSHGSFNEWMDFSDLGQPKTGQPMARHSPHFQLRFFAQVACVSGVKPKPWMWERWSKTRRSINQSHHSTDGMGNLGPPRAPKDVSGHGETMVKPMVKPLWDKKSVKGKYFYLPKNRCMDWNIWFSRCVAIEFQANLGGGFIFVCIHRCFFYKQNTVN